MPKKVRKKLVKILFNEAKIRKALKQQGTSNVFIPKLGEVERADEWIEIIEKSRSLFSRDKNLIYLRYYRHMSWTRLSCEVDRSVKTIFEHCDKFLVDLGLRATTRKLISYDEE